MTRKPAGLTLPPRPGSLLDENAGSTLSENQHIAGLRPRGRADEVVASLPFTPLPAPDAALDALLGRIP
ncbi:hypothetical protein GGQ96_002029 [Sphingomonas abaci]|uniref:Uncharacterized protein n=1 Tax=Sphingomonas abaci TaxID=237611 RepID=A0A7W7AIY4_9SPHN|nr:hypothetical protein [Sphingomonas abaci]